MLCDKKTQYQLPVCRPRILFYWEHLGTDKKTIERIKEVRRKQVLQN